MARPQLSEQVSLAVQMALAIELGMRIDRVVKELGGFENDARVTQADLEAKAKAARVQWQVIAHAFTREKERRG